MCIVSQHNPIFQATYRPIEAALLWSDLHQYREYILDAAWGTPGQFTQCLRYWPDLNKRFNKIMDAITHSELPSILSDFEVPLAIADNCMHMRIRHVELQRWMVRYYPNQRPSFLFGSGPSCPFSDELCSTLSLRVDSLNARHQADREEIDQVKAELEVANQQLKAVSEQLARASIPNEKRRSNYERTIAVLIELLLQHKPQDIQKSPLKTQDAIISLIETHYPNMQGLSRRALQTRFADSLSTLNEERYQS